MSLTDQQIATLAADIAARPELAAYVAAGQDNAITAFYNADAPGPVKAWRTDYSADDLFAATKLTEYIARSAGERQAFDLLLSRASIDPTRKAIRDAIADIFSGASNSSSRAAILGDMVENASRLEVLLGGNTVTTDVVSALKRNHVGDVTDAEIAQALRG